MQVLISVLYFRSTGKAQTQSCTHSDVQRNRQKLTENL